ncbi:MAG: ATP synthase F1 subunit delta [Deltaproteobacteria bacterium RIFCSPLOWO2_02_FULL_44_10]|nr:MAG: ATP synthase F1 subunit delta [Deltaproteobacteria bacterium RIFCSPHIGHO2_02_FULL_44_16]OGQ47277.1 MAG: ATP synthase F1 subunit delta [Deltaproteobacteria bacterium RIFCSPLOWO2_02_FULL_44_10]
MKSSFIADRYARAFFSLAVDEKQPEKYFAELMTLLELSKEIPFFLRAFSDPHAKIEKRYEVVDQVGKILNLNSHTISFLKLLIEKGRITLLPSLVESYRLQQEQYEGLTPAEVTVAESALADDTVNQIHTILKNLLGRKASCHMNVDPALFGGFVVRVGDTMYDASLKGRLERMKEEMLSI